MTRSAVTRIAAPSHEAYAASKDAVETMTLALAPQLGSRNITVNAVIPGVTETGMKADWINTPKRGQRPGKCRSLIGSASPRMSLM